MPSSKLAAPFTIAAILGVLAVIAMWLREPILAPSLGSAVFSQLLHPTEKSSTPYAVFVGQVLGAVAGFAAVYIAGAAMAPPFMSGHPLAWARVAAVVIAGVIAPALQIATGALTPAGGATALVVALGLEGSSLTGASHLAIGLVLATAMGEAARRVLLRQHASAG